MKTILNSTINMLKSRLILLIIPLFFSCSESIKTIQKPLNVVWISCEDMGPILGSYCNELVKSPNLDKLARLVSIDLIVFYLGRTRWLGRRPRTRPSAFQTFDLFVEGEAPEATWSE